MNNLKKEYEKFVLNYIPFKWEINKDENRDLFKNKHTFEIGYKRFFKVFEALNRLKSNLKKPKIIDVGAYPGNMIQLTQEVFNSYENYTSIGLDLNKNFVETVKQLNVKCIDTEIDPNFSKAKEIKNWNLDNYDICYLLDTIEHLVDPIFCLESINKSLKKGGFLILTTDNITNFFYILRMLFKGKSPNAHPVLTSMFFKGNHRPHSKEFSKEELLFFLNYTGFEVLTHEYFDRMQGEYKIIDKKMKKKKLNLNLKELISTILKKIFYTLPHLRNHQIILAKKTENIDELERIKPTVSPQEWMNLRLKTIGY